jgi:hypothetical protein
LGVRLVVANFSHGHHGDATDADNPRVRWRYDPAMAGVSGQFADCGIHALHMASFITGDEVEKLSADFASTISSRVLEDDAMVNFRMSGGTVGRLWTSSVAIGRQHGFDIQVFGETGGMRWASEQPNQVYYTPVGGRTQIMEKGEAGLSGEAARLSRVAIAHPEGFPLAVANIYVDLAAAIRGEARDGLPLAEDGLRSMAAVAAAVTSAQGAVRMGGRAAPDVSANRTDLAGQSARSAPRPPTWRFAGAAPAFRQSGRQFSQCHHPAGKEPRFGVAVGPALIVSTTSSTDALDDLRHMGWRIVVRLIFCQRAIAISFSPIIPISSGTRNPASCNGRQRADGEHIIAAEIGLRMGRLQKACHFRAPCIKGIGCAHS